MSNQTTDLSDYPTLPFYEVAEAWAKEKEIIKPVIVRLHQIAAAIYDGSLRIDVDEKWKIPQGTKKTTVGYRDTRPSWLKELNLNSYPAKIAPEIRIDQIYAPWTAEHSPCILELKDPPPSPQEPKNIKTRLNHEGITINREHFRAWCQSAGYPLPRFWFGSEADTGTQTPPAATVTALPEIRLEHRLAPIVSRLFWSAPPPEGHNRPTKKQIVAWLLEYAEADGLTEKAAGRIYTSTRPAHIPQHGNLPQSKKPFPTPPLPER